MPIAPHPILGHVKRGARGEPATLRVAWIKTDVPCAGKSRSGRTYEPCRGLGPVPQIGQSPSPWLSNQTVQPGPSRSTIGTFCFGTGAKTADFSILPDAVSRPRMQHRPSSTQSEAEPIAVRLAVLLSPGLPQEHDRASLAKRISPRGRGRSSLQPFSAVAIQ